MTSPLFVCALDRLQLDHIHPRDKQKLLQSQVNLFLLKVSCTKSMCAMLGRRKRIACSLSQLIMLPSCISELAPSQATTSEYLLLANRAAVQDDVTSPLTLFCCWLCCDASTPSSIVMLLQIASVHLLALPAFSAMGAAL